MREGDIVVVFGKLDNRIVERKLGSLIFGTLYYFLTEDRVCVIIDNNELWIGPKREIAPADQQR